MIKTLETLIYNKLITMSNFAQVYKYFTLETDGYPFVAFEHSKIWGSIIDVATKDRTFTYSFMLVQNYDDEQTTREQAKDILYDCIDAFIDEFDWVTDFGNSDISNIEVMKWEFWTFVWESWNALSMTMDIVIHTIKTIK